MGKEDVVYLYSGILLSHKKNETVPFIATRIDPEIIILNEASQTEKDKYVVLIICEIQKMIQMNLFTKQKQTHRHRK